MHVTYLVKLAGVQGSFWVQELQPCTDLHVPPSLFFLFLPSIHLTAGHLCLLCLFCLDNYRLRLCFLLALLWEYSPLDIRSFTCCSGIGFALWLWSRRYWRTIL